MIGQSKLILVKIFMIIFVSYNINFFDEKIVNLNNFTKTYNP